MGIARLTQDLDPYLESAFLSSRPDTGNDGRIRLDKLVIDGPSLVYHVYSKLAARESVTLTALCDSPTYAQLNLGIELFLEVLSNHGVTIAQIYFDGSLPTSKRSVRLDRLEKSRAALEAQKLLHPSLMFTEGSLARVLDRQHISDALWQVNSSVRKSSVLTPPFIVPSVIDSLKCSKWSKRVSVVPGEAETYCAPQAKEINGAVLTNDSDLVLFDDLGDIAVVLLHTLRLNGSAPSQPSVLEARCWRPREVTSRLEVPRLAYLGFERQKDSMASAAIIAQRARARAMHASSDPEQDFNNFENQFVSISSTAMSMQAEHFQLNDLDPRLSELICQVFTSCGQEMQGLNAELMVTLPMLLEDPARDSSWAYGKDFRCLGYTWLLIAHALPIQDSGSSPSRFKPPDTITEYTRKGQRIAPEKISATSLIDLMQDVYHRLILIDHYLQTAPRVSKKVTAMEPGATIGWHLLALHLALAQRGESGKRMFSALTIARYLGLVPISKGMSQRSSTEHSDPSWALLHLNANVQAVLYSLRMLEKALRFVHTRMQQETALRKAHESGVEAEVAQNIRRMLSSMLSIEKLFLDVAETRSVFQAISRKELNGLLMPLAQQFDLVESLGLQASKPVRPRAGREMPEVSGLKQVRLNADGAFQLIEHRTKRKKPPSTPEGRSKTSGSTNPFEVLKNDN